MTDSAYHYNLAFDIEQDAIIAHAQLVRGFALLQPLNVAVQAMLEPFDLPQNLRSLFRWQVVQVVLR